MGNLRGDLKEIVVNIIAGSNDSDFKRLSWNIITSLARNEFAYPHMNTLIEVFGQCVEDMFIALKNHARISIRYMVSMVEEIRKSVYGYRNKRIMKTGDDAFRTLTDIRDQLNEEYKDLSAEDLLINFIVKMNQVVQWTKTETEDEEIIEKHKEFVLTLKILLIFMYLEISDDLDIFDTIGSDEGYFVE